jgi:hypothetical protein
MFFKGKYIIVGDNTPIVFPETVTHSDMAHMVRICGQAKSAGFVYTDEKGYHCYGESISLNLKSSPDDSKILNKYLGGGIYD